MATLRTCAVDDSKYSYCPKCGKDDPTELWRKNFCSENCREISNITIGYVQKRLTAVEAKIALNKLDISKIEDFRESYKNTIGDIMFNAIDVVVEPEIQTINEDIVDYIEVSSNETAEDSLESNIEESIEESIDENADIKKKKRNKRFM